MDFIYKKKKRSLKNINNSDVTATVCGQLTRAIRKAPNL